MLLVPLSKRDIGLSVNFNFILKRRLYNSSILPTIFKMWEVFARGYSWWVFHHLNEMLCSTWSKFQQWDKYIAILDRTSLLILAQLWHNFTDLCHKRLVYVRWSWICNNKSKYMKHVRHQPLLFWRKYMQNKRRYFSCKQPIRIFCHFVNAIHLEH